MARHGRAARAAATLLLLGSTTCSGLDEISVSETARSTIEGGGLLEQLASDAGFGALATFDVSQSAALQNQGVSRNQIDSVRLTRLGIAVVDPAGQDLTFFDELEFFVSADGLPRVRIAHQTDFPAGAAQVDLQLDDVDLADYAAAPSMAIDTEVTGRRPPQDTELEATLELLVDVDLDGAACGS